jgi:ATP-binding cassette subfamily B protein
MLKRFFRFYIPYKKILLCTLAGAVLTSLIELFFPLYIRYIMNEILPRRDIPLLLEVAVGLLLLYVFNCFINYQVMKHGRTVGALIEQDMRSAIFRHVERMSFRFFDNQRVGQLVSRIVGDVGEIRELIFLGPNYLLVCSIFMVGTVSILFYLNWELALLVNLLLLAKAYDSVSTNRKLKRAGREARSQVGNLNAQTTESLNAVRLVQSFNNEELEGSKLDAVAARLLAARKKSFALLSHSNVAMVFFSNITNLTIIVAGGVLITLGRMEISDLIAFMLYVSIFVRPILRLNALAETYQKGLASYQRFEQLMLLEPEIVDSPDAREAGVLRGEISFENVTFAYDDKSPVVENLTLQIAAGESVAFVGSTGVGKSTLCNLVARFYEPQQGRILIDGQDIRELTLASLRNNIGIVQQDIFLFADSVANNIAYGRPSASQAEIEEAARLAEADRFIERLPQQYQSALGERGVKLSGGQKQRIAIARVFLKNPPILILDEATSSLDNETEKNIQGALNELAHNRTTLVVAHRLATVRHVDRIIVLSRQGIVEQGSHEELMRARGDYHKLYTAQTL